MLIDIAMHTYIHIGPIYIHMYSKLIVERMRGYDESIVTATTVNEFRSPK